MGNDADLPLPYEIDPAIDIYEPAAYLEEVVIATPLADADSEALEQGIAHVFDSIRAEETATEDEVAEPTYLLLEELNRIWAQAA